MVFSCRFLTLLGLTLCLLFPTNIVAQDSAIVRRAAFDIGSAAIKCTIADVDITTGRIVKIVETLSQKVDFAEDLARSYDGNLSKDIQNKGIDVIKEMKLKAIELQAVEFSGVGGAAARTARNGRAYFVLIKEETGIPCRIISVQRAALLSFHAVRQQLDEPSMDLLVWDIGGGSMRMTIRSLDGSLIFHVDAMASVSFKNVVVGMIQKKDINMTSSPNPMSKEEVAQALNYAQSYAEMNVPPPLMARIRNSKMTVAGIGGVHYYSIPETLGGREKTYSREEVEKALEKWTGKFDEDFNSEYADTRLTNLILVLGYMNALNFDTIHPLKVNEADGLLAVPEFW